MTTGRSVRILFLSAAVGIGLYATAQAFDTPMQSQAMQEKVRAILKGEGAGALPAAPGKPVKAPSQASPKGCVRDGEVPGGAPVCEAGRNDPGLGTAVKAGSQRYIRCDCWCHIQDHPSVLFYRGRVSGDDWNEAWNICRQRDLSCDGVQLSDCR